MESALPAPPLGARRAGAHRRRHCRPRPRERAGAHGPGLLLQVHNLILIALSAGMAGSAVYWAVQGRYNFWGNAFKASEKEMALTIYVFYMSKFYEFFDTVRLRGTHPGHLHASAAGRVAIPPRAAGCFQGLCPKP